MALARNDHLGVNDFALLDDRLAVEREGAVAHRHVVMPAGAAVAAALAVRSGREQEVAGKHPRGGTHALGRVAIQAEPVPGRLRIEAPAEMRDGIGVAVVGRGLVVVEPVFHQLGVEATADRRDKAVAHVEPDAVDDVARIRKDDDVARLDHHRAVGAAFVGEGVDVAGAPVVETPGLVGKTVLAHHRKVAAAPGQVGAGVGGDARPLGGAVEPIGMEHRVLQAGRRHQLLEIIRRVDDHQHAHTRRPHLLEPAREQRHVEDHDHVGVAQRFERALALADRGHADLGPARDHVDAHLIDVGALLLRRRERRLDVFAAGGEIGDAGDGLALGDVAQLELLAEKSGELAGIELLRTERGMLHRGSP